MAMSKRAREAVKRVRTRNDRDRRTSSLVRIATAGALGYSRRSGFLDMIPEIMGSRIATIALVTGAGGMFLRGKVGERLMDVAETSAAVAAYQFLETGNTASISGHDHPRALASETRDLAVSDALREMARQTRERISGFDDDEDDDDEDDVSGDLVTSAIVDV